MICPNCGDEIREGQNFCAGCGFSFLSQQDQAQFAQIRSARFQQMQGMNAPQMMPAPVRSAKKGLPSWAVVIIVIGVLAFIGFIAEHSPDKEKTDDNNVRQRTAVSESYDEDDDDTIGDIFDDEPDERQLKPVTIEETMIYDANSVKIYITGIEDNIVKFYIENDSDKNYGFNAHSYAINGIMTRNNIYDMDCDVASKSKANAKLEIDYSFIEEFDITAINTIDINFWAYDNAISVKDFDTGCLRIDVIKGGNAKVEKAANMYDNNSIMVDYVGHEGKDYKFCVKNKREELIDFDIEDVTVNGYTDSSVDYDLYGNEVLNGCQYVYTIHIDDEFLKDNGIDNIESIQFNVKVRDNADYFEEWSTGNISVDVD